MQLAQRENRNSRQLIEKDLLDNELQLQRNSLIEQEGRLEAWNQIKQRADHEFGRHQKLLDRKEHQLAKCRASVAELQTLLEVTD